MALLTPQPVDPVSGIVPVLTGVNSSDTFVNDGKTALVVNNGSASAVTVTIPTVALTVDDPTYGAHTFADLVVTVPAGARRTLPFLKPARFNANGVVTVNYSATASVTAGAVVFQRPQ